MISRQMVSNNKEWKARNDKRWLWVDQNANLTLLVSGDCSSGSRLHLAKFFIRAPRSGRASSPRRLRSSHRWREELELQRTTSFAVEKMNEFRERESSSLGFLCSWKAMVINPLLANSQRRETTATEETLFSSAASALPRMKFLTRQNTKNRTFYLETFYFEKKMFASLKY